jgi:hypothetical protein
LHAANSRICGLFIETGFVICFLKFTSSKNIKKTDYQTIKKYFLITVHLVIIEREKNLCGRSYLLKQEEQ